MKFSFGFKKEAKSKRPQMKWLLLVREYKKKKKRKKKSTNVIRQYVFFKIISILLENVSELIKYLGVTINQYLTWHDHI